MLLSLPEEEEEVDEFLNGQRYQVQMVKAKCYFFLLTIITIKHQIPFPFALKSFQYFILHRAQSLQKRLHRY
jgi:hypothetical protein